MDRRQELDVIFKDVDDDEKKLVGRLLDEVVFLEDRMSELRAMPFLNIHPNNPAIQKMTPAAKLYKECSQSYMNAIRILCGILNKVEPTAKDDLLKLLENFQ